jgi:hypothetical protein
MTTDGLTAHPLIRALLALDLPVCDYVIFGSGPLLAHGLRTDIGDLDLVARGLAWQQVATLADPVACSSGHGHMVRLYGGAIEVVDAWLSPAWDTDALIDGAELIAGLPFVPLHLVYTCKFVLRRPKDAPDLAALDAWLTAGQTRRVRELTR